MAIAKQQYLAVKNSNGYHEVIKTKKPDTDTELKGPDSTFRSGSTFRKKKKRKGNTDWVKSSMDYD